MSSERTVWNDVMLLIEQGTVDAAKKMLMQLEKKASHGEGLRLMLITVLKIRVLLQEGKFRAVLEQAKLTMDSVKATGDVFLTFHLQAMLVEALLQLGKFKDSQAILHEMSTLLESPFPDNTDSRTTVEMKAIYHYLKGRHHFRQASHDLAHEHLMTALKLLEMNDNLFWKGRILKDLGSVSGAKGEYQQAITYLEQALPVFQQLGNDKELGAVHNNLGVMYWGSGNITTALRQYDKARHHWEKCKYRMGVATVLNNQAMILSEQGEFHQALLVLQEVLRYWREMGNDQEISRTLNNIGIIYRYKGELNKALACQLQALEIQKTITNDQELGELYHEIARLYHLTGDFLTAKKFYHQSATIKREIGNETDLFSSLFWLLVLEIETSSLENARNIMSEFQEFSGTTTLNSRSQLYLRLAKAYSLKQEHRLETLARSLQEFRDMANAKPIIDLELTMFASFNYCELLLVEIIQLENDAALRDLSEIVSRLRQMTTEEHSFLWLSEIRILEARLAMLQYQFDEALAILMETEQLIEKQHADYLKKRISMMIDDLLMLSEQLKTGNLKFDTLKQRLRTLKLVDQIKSLSKGSLSKIPEPAPEKPILLVITSSSGIPFISKTLDPDIQANEMLIGGFLAAINSFGKEIFSRDDALDRVHYKNHTILFVPDGNLLFCYIFMGHSHSARKKIETIIETIKRSPELWKDLQRNATVGVISKSLKERLHQVLQETLLQLFPKIGSS